MSAPDFLRTYRQRVGADIGPSRFCCYVAGTKPYGPDPFCGAPSKPGCSYCERHHAICHVAPDPEKARNQIRGAMKIIGAES